MRQIRPRTRLGDYRSSPTPELIVDLRIDSPPDQVADEQALRRELDQACRVVNAAVLRLSTLIDHRENLKAQLGELLIDVPAAPVDDPSIVAWGFCEDDELSFG